jgi:hypothetical protein
MNNEIYTIHPELLPKNWKVGHTIEGCQDLSQYEIIDQDESGKKLVLLRKLPPDERVDRGLVMGELKAEPNLFAA